MKTSLILSEGRQELILEPENEQEARALAFLTAARDPQFMVVPYHTTLKHGGRGDQLLLKKERNGYSDDPLPVTAIRINPMPVPEPRKAPTLHDFRGLVAQVFAHMETRRRKGEPFVTRKDLKAAPADKAGEALCNEFFNALLIMGKEEGVINTADQALANGFNTR